MKSFKIYSDNIEAGALNQFYEAMKQEFIVKGALMPDAHLGYTLPIGGVVACDGVVVPAYVGYDIGCGVCACKTSFSKDDITSNKNPIPFDSLKPSAWMGLRLGVGAATTRGLQTEEFKILGKIIAQLIQGRRC